VTFFTVEEWGLTGSRHYGDQLGEADCDRIALAVNLDSVAGSPWLTALTSVSTADPSWKAYRK
jgi:aminopeptidase YwaD